MFRSVTKLPHHLSRLLLRAKTRRLLLPDQAIPDSSNLRIGKANRTLVQRQRPRINVVAHVLAMRYPYRELPPKLIDLVPLLAYPLVGRLRLVELHDLLAVIDFLLVELDNLLPLTYPLLLLHVYLIFYPFLGLSLQLLMLYIGYVRKIGIHPLIPFIFSPLS